MITPRVVNLTEAGSDWRAGAWLWPYGFSNVFGHGTGICGSRHTAKASAAGLAATHCWKAACGQAL